VLLPKVQRAEHVAWLTALGQIEHAIGLPAGRIGIGRRSRTQRGAVDAIAAGSARLEALVFGPADFRQPINMRASGRRATPALASATRTTTC
jgi:citrate lyase subunit beta/citryl-CoA lyase